MQVEFVLHALVNYANQQFLHCELHVHSLHIVLVCMLHVTCLL